MNHGHIDEVMLIPCWVVEGKTQCSGSNLTTGLADFSPCTAAEGEIIKPPANLPISVIAVLVLRHVARLMQHTHVLF